MVTNLVVLPDTVTASSALRTPVSRVPRAWLLVIVTLTASKSPTFPMTLVRRMSPAALRSPVESNSESFSVISPDVAMIPPLKTAKTASTVDPEMSPMIVTSYLALPATQTSSTALMPLAENSPNACELSIVTALRAHSSPAVPETLSIVMLSSRDVTLVESEPNVEPVITTSFLERMASWNVLLLSSTDLALILSLKTESSETISPVIMT